METPPITTKSRQGRGVSLHDIINEILIANTLKAAQIRTVIYNEVETGIRVYADILKVRALIGKIIELIILLTRDTQVSISAKTYSDLILIHFREKDFQSISILLKKIQLLMPEAVELGGFLGISSYENKLTTIALTILNQKDKYPTSYADRLSKTIAIRSGS